MNDVLRLKILKCKTLQLLCLSWNVNFYKASDNLKSKLHFSLIKLLYIATTRNVDEESFLRYFRWAKTHIFVETAFEVKRSPFVVSVELATPFVIAVNESTMTFVFSKAASKATSWYRLFHIVALFISYLLRSLFDSIHSFIWKYEKVVFLWQSFHTKNKISSV